jgi:hypothetical protein
MAELSVVSWQAWMGSNHRPSASKAAALPLSYTPSEFSSWIASLCGNASPLVIAGLVPAISLRDAVPS